MGRSRSFEGRFRGNAVFGSNRDEIFGICIQQGIEPITCLGASSTVRKIWIMNGYSVWF